jgi:hypothetical protein
VHTEQSFPSLSTLLSPDTGLSSAGRKAHFLNHPSPICSWISENFSEAHSALAEFTWYRRLLTQYLHTVPLVIVDDPVGIASRTFDPLYPILNRASRKVKGDDFILLLHDIAHGIMGDLAPYDTPSMQRGAVLDALAESDLVFSDPTQRELEAYSKGMMRFELEASYFSDIVVPLALGPDRFERLCGRRSVAHELLARGIPQEALRTCYVQTAFQYNFGAGADRDPNLLHLPDLWETLGDLRDRMVIEEFASGGRFLKLRGPDGFSPFVYQFFDRVVPCDQGQVRVSHFHNSLTAGTDTPRAEVEQVAAYLQRRYRTHGRLHALSHYAAPTEELRKDFVLYTKDHALYRQIVRGEKSPEAEDLIQFAAETYNETALGVYPFHSARFPFLDESPRITSRKPTVQEALRSLRALPEYSVTQLCIEQRSLQPQFEYKMPIPWGAEAILGDLSAKKPSKRHRSLADIAFEYSNPGADAVACSGKVPSSNEQQVVAALRVLAHDRLRLPFALRDKWDEVPRHTQNDILKAAFFAYALQKVCCLFSKRENFSLVMMLPDLVMPNPYLGYSVLQAEVECAAELIVHSRLKRPESLTDEHGQNWENIERVLSLAPGHEFELLRRLRYDAASPKRFLKEDGLLAGFSPDERSLAGATSAPVPAHKILRDVFRAGKQKPASYKENSKLLRAMYSEPRTKKAISLIREGISSAEVSLLSIAPEGSHFASEVLAPLLNHLTLQVFSQNNTLITSGLVLRKWRSYGTDYFLGTLQELYSGPIRRLEQRLMHSCKMLDALDKLASGLNSAERGKLPKTKRKAAEIALESLATGAESHEITLAIESLTTQLALQSERIEEGELGMIDPQALSEDIIAEVKRRFPNAKLVHDKGAMRIELPPLTDEA